MTGSATHAAALKLRAKALEMAAALLQARPTSSTSSTASCVHRDRPGGPSISLGEIARHLAPDSPTLGDRDPGLDAEGWFRTDAHDLSLRRADRRRAGRSRHRRR